VNKNSLKILKHFENISDTFDSIYRGQQRSFVHKIIDILFRKSILERRLKLILGFSGNVQGKNVLDIGCGSGRYSVMLAKDEPNFVLGLDISSLMIDLAKKLAEANNVTNICRFENCDFLQKSFNAKFDIIIASGVFDYVSDAKEFLLKIKSILNGKALLSFPVKWNVMTPLRMAWLQNKGCPNYYYSKKRINKLFKECGLKIDSLQKIGSFLVPGNYIIVCSPCSLL